MNERDLREMETAPEGLDSLRVKAPAGSLDQFRRRAILSRRTRSLLERQLYGFWIVLNTLLRLLFKHVRVPVRVAETRTVRRYRRAVRHSRRERREDSKE